MGKCLMLRKNEDAECNIKCNINDVERSTRDKIRGKMLKCPLPRAGPLHLPQAGSTYSSDQSSTEGGGGS